MLIMKKATPTPGGKALTDLILDLFRLNNHLVAAGDRVVASVGLTSARWKVMGTIVAAEQSRPVAWLARDMGGKRQNVQRIVNDLVTDGMVEFQPNPHHRRAPLVVLTAKGEQAFADAMRLQAPWVNDLSRGLAVKDIATAHEVITSVCKRLEQDDGVSA